MHTSVNFKEFGKADKALIVTSKERLITTEMSEARQQDVSP